MPTSHKSFCRKHSFLRLKKKYVNRYLQIVRKNGRQRGSDVLTVGYLTAMQRCNPAFVLCKPLTILQTFWAKSEKGRELQLLNWKLSVRNIFSTETKIGRVMVRELSTKGEKGKFQTTKQPEEMEVYLDRWMLSMFERFCPWTMALRAGDQAKTVVPRQPPWINRFFKQSETEHFFKTFYFACQSMSGGMFSWSRCLSFLVGAIQWSHPLKNVTFFVYGFLYWILLCVQQWLCFRMWIIQFLSNGMVYFCFNFKSLSTSRNYVTYFFHKVLTQMMFFT